MRRTGRSAVLLGRLLGLLALVAASAGCAASAGTTTGEASPQVCTNPEPAPSGSITLVTGGLTRSYLLSLPDPAPTSPAPLILNLHGAGSNAAQQAIYSGLATRGPAAGFIVVTPNGTGPIQQWNVAGDTQADDVGFVDALIGDVSLRACVDPTRLYATGISSGAAMSSLLACKEADRFRKIAPVAGVVWYGPLCPDGPAASVVAFHGTDDFVVPYRGGPILTRKDVTYPGAIASMAGWASRGSCNPEPDRTSVSAHVTLSRWVGCAPGTTVELYTIDGGGHTWPGAIQVPALGTTTDEIDATAIILQAFST